jgi:hypothetical protein
LRKYLENLDSIDAAHFAAINRAKGLEKVIILPLDHTGTIHLGFTLQEFENLKAVIRNYLSEEKKQGNRLRKVAAPDVQAVTPKTEGCFNIYEFKALN